MTHIPATAAELSESRELISQLCEEMLSREGQHRLEQLMRAHRSIRSLYIGLIHLHGALRQRAGSLNPMGVAELEERGDLNDAMILPAVNPAVYEANADEAGEVTEPSILGDQTPVAHEQAIESPRSAGGAKPSPLSPARLQPAARSRSTLFRFAAAAVVLLAVSIAIVLLTRPRPSQATLTEAVGAQFAQDQLSVGAGTRLPSGRQIDLRQGFVGLTLDGGAQVVVEAPAIFRIDTSNAMTLLSGKISAVASEPAHGFAVLTPTARIVDLGTEFCVGVSDAQTTEVQVFRGKVRAAPLSAADSSKAPAGETLIAGDSAEVMSGVVSRTAGGASAQAFVRSLTPLTSPIDVVDLVAGGDGTTHRRRGQIDPRTGETGKFEGPGKILESTGEYHQIHNLSVFDGCFVPGGATTVDSDGHQLNFPNTGRFAYYYITAAGTVDWPVKDEAFTNVLDGVDYSQLPHGFVLMHSNSGLTIDLAALRRLHPGLSLLRFTAILGNSYRPTAPGVIALVHKADAYVIVDGAPRFARREFTCEDGAIPIDVPMHNSDRFLTLVVTDGSDARLHDWVIFGDPKLQ